MTRTELLNALSQIALDARLAFEDGDKEALIKKYDENKDEFKKDQEQ